MTSPQGADAAGDRNRAAVETLDAQAAIPVRAAINAMLAEVLSTLTTSGDIAPTVDTVAAAAATAWRRVVDRVLAWVRDTFTTLVTRAIGNLPDDTPEVSPRTVEQRVQQVMDDVASGLDSVPDVVASRTATTLREGYDRGESPAELRERVADVLDEDAWAPEVERIARTTTTTVYNAAHTAVANELENQLGEPLRRMWIATQDTRTRPTHREAHAQVINSGELFEVGEARLRFPGDPLGPVEEIANCRCLAVPVLHDMVIDLAHRVAGREADALTNQQPDQVAANGGPGWATATWQAWRLLAARALNAVSRIPPALRVYWTRGEGAAKIRWGTRGDFNRCRRALRKYVTPAQLNGLCANLHHAALGVWPGQERATADAEAAVAASTRETDMPCPCESMTDDELKAAVAQLDNLAATVIGDPDLPFADRDHVWDGSAAGQRVADWATSGDTLDAEKYSRAFFYRDPDADPTTVGAYKFGFADIIDGELRAVPKGIFAVAAVLQGGRGGADIPADEQDRIRGRVGSYYRRMADSFDDDSIVAPWADDAMNSTATSPASGDAGQVTAATLDEARAGGMVALLPTAADADRLAVDGDGAIPANELHITLLFLGDDGQELQDSDTGAMLTDLAERVAADIGPITGSLWQIGATSSDAATGDTVMYLVGDDTGRLAELQAGLVMAAGDAIIEQRSPWVAHISTRYGNGSLDGMDQLGTDVTFDRIRVSLGDQDQDYELTGDESLDLDDDRDDDGEHDEPADDTPPPAPAPAPAPATTASGNTVAAGSRLRSPRRRASRAYSPDWAPQVALLAAAAADQIVARAAEAAPAAPPADWFRRLQVDGPTPPTVTAEGRVWGHIGQAGVCHVAFRDECVTIPPTRTGYGAFHRGEIQTAEGDMVAVGYLYTGCDHSSLDSTIDEARNYLDASCTRTAVGRVHDTEFGPLFTGAVVAGATAADVAGLHRLSGEWFSAPLELHAAVGVENAGFPVDGTEESVRTAPDAPPLAASAAASAAVDSTDAAAAATSAVTAAVTLIEDYQRDRAGAAVLTAVRDRASRMLDRHIRRG